MMTAAVLFLLFSSFLEKQTKMTQTDNGMQMITNSKRAAGGIRDNPALNPRLGNDYYLILLVKPRPSLLLLIGIFPNPQRVDS